VAFDAPIANPMIGFSLKTKQGVSIYGSNSYIEERALASVSANSVHIYRMAFRVSLNVGDYFFDIGLCLADGTTGGTPVDVRRSTLHFTVAGAHRFPRDGLIDLAPEIAMVR